MSVTAPVVSAGAAAAAAWKVCFHQQPSLRLFSFFARSFAGKQPQQQQQQSLLEQFNHNNPFLNTVTSGTYAIRPVNATAAAASAAAAMIITTAPSPSPSSWLEEQAQAALWFAVPKQKVTRHKKRLKTTLQKRIKLRHDIITDPRTGETTLRHKMPANWKDYLPKVE